MHKRCFISRSAEDAACSSRSKRGRESSISHHSMVTHVDHSVLELMVSEENPTPASLVGRIVGMREGLGRGAEVGKNERLQRSSREVNHSPGCVGGDVLL